MNSGEKQWEKMEYGVKTEEFFSDKDIFEVFNSQDEEFGGWETSGNKGKVLRVENGKIYINLPKYSVLVFGDHS